MKNKSKKTYKKNAAKPVPVGISEWQLEHIRTMADTLCASEELELVHVEYQSEASGRILRIYIDKPGGVGIDDCSRISRQMGDLLDVYIENEASYNLEVSSPGSERPLGRESDFEKYSGQMVRIKTKDPLGGKKKFYGKLLGIQEGIVSLQINDQVVRISHKDISQARLVNNDGENEC